MDELTPTEEPLVATPSMQDLPPTDWYSGLNELDGTFPFIVTVSIPDTDAATTARYGVVFVAPFPCMLLAAFERHKTKGTDASAVTLDVEKLTDTTAPGSGTTMLASTFDLKGNNNTYQSKTPTATPANTSLAKGEAVAVKTSGTLTAVNQVEVTLVFRVLTKYA